MVVMAVSMPFWLLAVCRLEGAYELLGESDTCGSIFYSGNEVLSLKR
jgi:hypothetical protein